MSRLIDADALFKAITDGKYTTGNIFKDMELQQFINKQPTAYDVEKVVAELEEEKEIVKEYEKYHCSVRLDKAIDIVRKGGGNE